MDSENPLDDPVDGRWMSYDELGLLRGIERGSAVKLALRSGWRRVKGNDGSARVYVPGEFLKPRRKSPRDASTGQPTGESTGLYHAIKAFQDGLAAFREQVQVERERANRLQAELTAAEGKRGAERQRAERAEQDRETLRGELSAEKEARAKAEGRTEASGERADRAEAELAGAQEALAGAETRLREAERQRAEFWAKRRWKRIRAVWRGRGG
jgi:hypothetical protein